MQELEMNELEAFEKAAHQAIDWIVDYYRNIENLPVKSQVKPGDIYKAIPEHAPDKAESYEKIVSDFEKILLPGMTHWQHPSFHAYFNANSSFPSILGEMFTAALAAQCMLWDTSPSATELEEKVLNWLKDACDLPSEWYGSIQDSASSATLCAVLSAREHVTNFQSNKEGLYSHTRLIYYCSEQAHSSAEKAIRIAGLGSDSLRKIQVDSEAYGMLADHLIKEIESDLKNGYIPTAIIGSAGTTGSHAFDPLEKLGQIAEKYDLWYHIDAAHAGNITILPEMRDLFKGMEKADSYVFNPHKWMFTNFDCSAYYVKNKDILLQTMGILPEYLKTSEDEHVINYKDWGVQLGRRFRALKLWFVLRRFGLNGIRDRFRNHLELSKYFLQLISKDERFELLAPAPLNLICFRYNPGDLSEPEIDDVNRDILSKINKSGQAYITHTKLSGKYTLRFVIGQTNVEAAHVEKFYRLLTKTVESVR
jgi:aromatic-L-amino-acid decarboxylase